MKKGDTFYYPSKYGGGIFGEVEEIIPINIIYPTFNGIRFNIRSTKEVIYDSKDIILVSKILTPEEVEKRKQAINNILKHPKLNEKR